MCNALECERCLSSSVRKRFHRIASAKASNPQFAISLTARFGRVNRMRKNSVDSDTHVYKLDLFMLTKILKPILDSFFDERKPLSGFVVGSLANFYVDV